MSFFCPPLAKCFKVSSYNQSINNQLYIRRCSLYHEEFPVSIFLFGCFFPLCESTLFFPTSNFGSMIPSDDLEWLDGIATSRWLVPVSKPEEFDLRCLVFYFTRRLEHLINKKIIICKYTLNARLLWGWKIYWSLIINNEYKQFFLYINVNFRSLLM